MPNFTSENINNKLESLRQLLEEKRQNNFELISLDNFLSLDLAGIKSYLSSKGINDIEEKANKIHTYVSIRSNEALMSAFANTLENIQILANDVISEVNENLLLEKQRNDLEISEIKKEIDFYERVSDYLFNISLSEENVPNITNFIINSSYLSEQEKFDLSLSIAKNALQRKLSSEIEEQVQVDEREIESFREELNSQQQTPTQVSTEENILKSKIDSLDIDEHRKELMHSIVNKYEDEYLWLFDEFDNLEFGLFGDKETLENNELDTIDMIDNDDFLFIIDYCLYALNSNSEDIEFVTNYIKALLNKFSLSSKDYKEKKETILREYIEPLKQSLRSRHSYDYETRQKIDRLREIEMELQVFRFSDEKIKTIEEELYHLKNPNIENEQYIDQDTIEPRNFVFAESKIIKVVEKICGNNDEQTRYLLKAFETLEKKERSYNPTVWGTFSNYSNIRDVNYVKAYQTRIFYKNLPDNTVYIFYIDLKKANRDMSEIKAVEKKSMHTSGDYEYVKKIFNSTDEESIQKKYEILAEGEKIKDNIYIYLKTGEMPRNMEL